MIQAAEILQKQFNVSVDIWGVTSFNQLRRDLDSVERHRRLHPDEKAKVSHVEKCLGADAAPVIAATDYVRLYADQIRLAVAATYHVLGTDGFGRSDTREALRRFFEIDGESITLAAISRLVIKNIVARTAVVLDRKLADPFAPKRVPDAPAPKAEPISAPFPFCNSTSTTMIIAIST